MNGIPGFEAAPPEGMHSPASEAERDMRSAYEVGRAEFSRAPSDKELAERLGEAESTAALSLERIATLEGRVSELEEENALLRAQHRESEDERRAVEEMLAEAMHAGMLTEAQAQSLKRTMAEKDEMHLQRIQELEHENRRLNEERYTDQMTGLKNKAALDTALEHLDVQQKAYRSYEESPDQYDPSEFGQSAEVPAKPKKIVFFDANNFGKINKHGRFGQKYGDTAIVNVGNAIKAAGEEFGIEIRDMFRVGGDEFVVLVDESKTDDFIQSVQNNFGIHIYNRAGYHRVSFDEVRNTGALYDLDDEASAIVTVSGKAGDEYNEASHLTAEKTMTKGLARRKVEELFHQYRSGEE